MKKLLSMILALSLLCTLAVPAMAIHYEGGDNWNVSFTENSRMESSFKTADMNDALTGLQPGDAVTFTIHLKNNNASTTRWYMTNQVLESLEDNSANSGTHGGAYTYRLVYNAVDGTQEVLFDSDTVGGDTNFTNREGLREATASLEDFFYLDDIANGESGIVTLEVALDGETQGNDYQDTLAELQMNFAVELVEDEPEPTETPAPGTTPNPTPTPGTPTTTTVVRTGDEMNLVPWYIAMAVSGLLFLALAIDSVRRRKREKEAGNR